MPDFPVQPRSEVYASIAGSLSRLFELRSEMNKAITTSRNALDSSYELLGRVARTLAPAE
jgi:hypothetical protein